MLATTFGFSQVGINTTNPKGALDVTSDDLGLVLPRVTRIEDVTNNNSALAENGTIVYDVSRNKTCFRISNIWICMANDASIAVTTPVPGPSPSRSTALQYNFEAAKSESEQKLEQELDNR